MAGPSRVAILGDGPAGTSLATFLAGAGTRVALFAAGRPPGLVVGESLVPAAIPLLRELEIEDEVKRYAEYKPGASFRVGAEDLLEIDFSEACTELPGYAYNVPRDAFDRTLLDRCRKSGTAILECTGRVEKGPTAGTLRLEESSLGEARRALGGDPEVIVDATGRRRTVARLLDLPTETGPRRDVALFAHWKSLPIDRTGHVHSDRLERGWCWRIPLPGAVSLGLVLPPETIRELGSGAEEQYEAAILRDPYLHELTAGAERTSDVVRYSNYQLRAGCAVGANWALVGDAFGFVDPVFSSGLFLAMQSAKGLAEGLAKGPRGLRAYERSHLVHLRVWQDAVDLFYDGRFFALLRLRGQRPNAFFRRVLHDHVSSHVPRIFTGEASRGGYSAKLLAFIADRGLPRDQEPRVL